MDGGFALRLLGPFEAGCDDEPVDVGGPRQRVVLARLALEAGRTVVVERLVDAVWGERPPETARRQVHTAISALRRRLDGVPGWGSLRTEPAGYRLDIDPTRVDLLRFETAVGEAHRLLGADRPGDAVRAFRDGLALWRGPALAGLGDRLGAHAARLEEARLAALEECLDHEARNGGGPRTLADLTQAHAEHPLRERFTAALMLALSRAGRQSEALAAYRRTAEALSGELGVDPGPLLERRFTEILRADLDPEPPAPAWTAPLRQLPASVPALIGRDREVAALDSAAFGQAAPGRPAIVVLGTAGIGKSTLAVAWAHRVAERYPDGQLYADLRGHDTLHPPLRAGDVLHRFLEALGVPAERIPGDEEGRAAQFRSIVAGRKLLLLLDNARDEEQIRPLLPGAPGSLVLVTSRTELTGLVAGGTATPLTLGTFDATRSRALLAERLGADRLTTDPGATDEVIRRCAGLPLALAVLGARALATPDRSLGTLARELAAAGPLEVLDAGLPAFDVRSVLSVSYAALGEEAARLFRLFGAHAGPDLTVPAAAALSDRPPVVVTRALRELTRGHLATEHETGRFALHDLLRAYAREIGHADHRPALRRLLDYYLATAYAGSVCTARRLARVVLPVPVSAGTFRDGDEALAWFGTEQANLDGLPARARDAGLPGHAWRLACAIGISLHWRGHWKDAIVLHQTELEATADPYGRQQLHYGLGCIYQAYGFAPEASRHLGRALALAQERGDTGAAADARLDVGNVLFEGGDKAKAIAHARTALAYYREHGEVMGEAGALNALGWFQAGSGDFRGGLELCEQSLARLHASGADDPVAEAAVIDSIGLCRSGLGDHDAAIEEYRRAAEIIGRRASRHRLHIAIVTGLAEAYRAAGRETAATREFERVAALRESLGLG
ncbi:AfsR/SARP family transcriptional regulator [Paractinoplanes lichenicola]|uniref:Winged helix-turn-helix domain-containing protein n=1 Tax=Paractinoplanes lichenicola TaxID=2802976 RepID=A0ABS1VEA6_9ACTN|nr:BTAD domain-containing putative transcriptional regulator [Actinoplanes lichenicola]MBL7253009.1 winged helix-turn-helix domain-containing protein [Actinoplanes lichenicola]